MGIYKFQPQLAADSSGISVYYTPPNEGSFTALAELEGWRYVFVPEGTNIPEQPPDIQWQPARLDASELARLKEACYLYQVIGNEVQKRIRERYSVDREAAFARLGASVALDMHELTDEERQEFKAYNDYVEEVRQWGRAERAAFGL